MGRLADPATLVLCAMLPRSFPRGTRAAWLAEVARARVPVTWAAGVDVLAEVTAAGGEARPTMAVAIEPAWLDARSTLRRMIGLARQATPGLETAILRGPRPLSHAAVLAEEGIRVVVADAVDASRHGSRRPAPAGWRCRNTVWGLWEVQAEQQRKAGLVHLLLHGSMPRPRPGSLHVLQAGRVTAERPLGGRLDRWMAWAERRTAGGRVKVVTADALADLVIRGGQPPVSGSVLKAA